MPHHTTVHIISSGAHKMFEDFSARARKDDMWRCLHTELSTDFLKDPVQKDILIQFLKGTFFDADMAEIFWLSSGHIFIFFQGTVRATVKNFESFLQQVQDDYHTEKADYHFFWELAHFWGYYDEVIEKALSFGSKDTKSVARNARRKPLLLIVEDDRGTRHMMQAMIEKECDIVVAWNATQAEDLYKKLLPNMAFLDVQIPYGDGEELAKTLCAFDPDSFIVMVSGALNPGREKRCLDAGVKGCVAKPATQEALLPFIAHYKQNALSEAV